MFYYLYEIRNNLNGKIYVGVHKTKSLDDGYMGSGKVIKRAIEKHGIENFTKRVIETFESSADMYAHEKEVVTEEFLARDDVYNLRRGGTGGFDHINKNGLGSRSGVKLGLETRMKMGHAPSDEERLNNSLRMRGRIINPNVLKRGSEHPASKPKSEAHKEKIRLAVKRRWDEKHAGRVKMEPRHIANV